MITDVMVRTLAQQHRVAPEVICTSCGRPSFTSAHHGHVVTRLRAQPPARVQVTSVAPRTTRVPARPPIEWMTVYDIAHEMGVSKMTVYRMLHSGELPSHRIGRSFRIKRTAFDAWMAGTVTAVELIHE